MTFPKLFTKELDDTYSQANAARVVEFFASDAVTRCGFEYLSHYAYSALETAVPHHLSYIPLDIIITHVSTGTATIDHSKTTSTHLYITAPTGATVRMLVGRYL